MKNIIIIGRPRSGKSTLANKIADKFHYQIIRTDCIRDTFNSIFPELSIGPFTAIENEHFQLYLKKYLELSLEESRYQYGFVMEGCETSVKTCKKLYDNENTLIYVLGQIQETPENMANNMKKYDTIYDWSYHMQEDLIQYCIKQRQKAIHLQEECKKLGLNFFDTSVNREFVLEEILKDIESKIFL